jgi:hypothetical protein
MPPKLRLLEDGRAVGDDLEPTAARRDQLDRGVWKPLLNLGRQPGSPRFVASEGAVFDRDVHRCEVGERIRVPSSSSERSYLD